MMYAVPAAAAARAAATSPRGQSMPDSPVGPMITGRARRSPNSTVDWSRSVVPFSGVGKNSQSPNAASLRVPRDLVLGAAVAEVEHHARQAPLRDPPQRFDAVPLPLQTTSIQNRCPPARRLRNLEDRGDA